MELVGLAPIWLEPHENKKPMTTRPSDYFTKKNPKERRNVGKKERASQQTAMHWAAGQLLTTAEEKRCRGEKALS